MFSGKIEHLVLANLLYDEKYTRKVLPFLKKDYFEDHSDKVLFEEINTFVNQYQSLPTANALQIQTGKRVDLSQDGYSEVVNVLTNLPEDEWDYEWKLNTTESWCKERAIYLALLESVRIADGKDSKMTRDAIPDILSTALSVSFDDHVGHDYIIDASDRYAAAALLQGKNVLYITLEMAEERIAERIDANLLNISIRDLETLPKQLYENKINSLSKKTQGKLIIKEYPTASAHSGHFKSLLNELSLKKSFRPDIIFIDYLNICASSRYKGTIVNSYTYVKAIAEELRGMAVEHNVPIVSATQTTRSGYSNTDVDLTDTSESFGLPATADFMFALISTEELEELGQICVKQLKNRYNDPTSNRKFIIGVDRSKMKLYDVDQSAQKDIIDSGQDDYEDETESKFRKKSFVDLKF